MALVCPVGHPAGVGTSFCRLCGRDYVETPDAPEASAPSIPVQGAAAPEPVGVGAAAPPVAAAFPPPPPAGAPVPPPAAAPVPPPPPGLDPRLVRVAPMPPVAEPMLVVPGAPVPDLQMLPPAPVEATGPHSPGLTVQVPLVNVPSQSEAPAVESEPVAEEEPDAPSKARLAVDRTVLLAGAGAGFVGGVVSALAVHSLLG